MEKGKSDNTHILFVGILVIISTFFAYGRYFGDSLRFDEAMEYWISYMDFKNMYGMINSTFQPPVYNVVMHFWLMISESVFWFKVSNILFYGIGTIGMLKAVQYACGGRFSSIIAVVVQASFSAMLYYNQICGEYVLVLPLLFWFIYSTLKTIKEKNWKEFVIWGVLAVLSMGTQYGAMFTIAGAGIVMLFVFCRQKDFAAIKKMIIVGAVSLIGFMLPLYYFFARNQMANQGETASSLGIGTIITGLYKAFDFMIYAWHNDYKGIMNIVLAGLVFVCIIAALISCYKNGKAVGKEKEPAILWALGICVVTLIGYALGVAIGFYGYGNYASRHTVLVLPVVIVASACLLSKCWKDSEKNYAVKGVMLISGLVFIGNSFHYVWYQHWNYDQIDTAMQTIAEVSEDIPVWVDFWATPTVLAYGDEDIGRRVEGYLSCMDKGDFDRVGNIIYTGTNDILQDFGGNLPDQCYILTTDQLENIAKLREEYTAKGWYVECIHENIPSVMAAGTQVWYFSKISLN